MASEQKFDTQVIEILGRQRLVGELLRAGLEVAIPARDRGIDLIAYADLEVGEFVARPIQMKSFSNSGFSVSQKYKRIVNLVLVYVWHLHEDSKVAYYALTYEQAVEVAEKMGWTKTTSWEKGQYSNNNPGKKLQELLDAYRILEPRQWYQKIVALRPAAEKKGV